MAAYTQVRGNGARTKIAPHAPRERDILEWAQLHLHLHVPSFLPMHPFYLKNDFPSDRFATIISSIVVISITHHYDTIC